MRVQNREMLRLDTEIMKNHIKVDGKLLQTNKRYENLKQKQKDIIMSWLYEAFEAKYLEKERMPDKRGDEEIVDAVYDRIQAADIWIPYGEVYRHYIAKKAKLRKWVERKLAKEREISVKYTTLIVSDLDASVAFYRDKLGFEEGYHMELGDNGRITIMNSPGGASVELIENSRFPIGMYSIGTDVKNLDKVMAGLREKGVEIIGAPIETTVGRQVFIKDPDGVNICLIEHSKEQKKK